MANDISVKLAVEGENTFKSAIKAADSQIKALDAQLKEAVSGFDDMTTAEEKATAKSKILAQQIDTQKTKLDALAKQHDKASDTLKELADALEKAKQEHGESSAEATKAANAYNRQATEVANLERQMAQTNTAINQETEELKKLENGVDDVTDEMGEAGQETSRFGDVLKANLSGQAIIDAVKKLGAALKDLVMDVAAYGDEVGDNAAKMGISTDAYQEWDGVLRRNGSSIEALKTSMKTLATAAQTGKDAFDKLGISQKELQELSQEDLFARTVEGLQNLESGTERTYIASQLLGKGATEMGALLDMSADDTAALKDEIKRLGGVMSGEAIQASDEFMDSTESLKDAFNGLTRDIGKDLLPLGTKLVKFLTDVLVNIREFRNTGFDDTAEGLQDLVENTKYWNDELERTDAFISSGAWDDEIGAQFEAAKIGAKNAKEQLQAYIASEEGQLEIQSLLQSGEMTMQEVMDATGWSASQLIGYMRDLANAQREEAEASAEPELTEEAIAAQEAADHLRDLTTETQFAARGNGDLRAEYERLKGEIEGCSEVEDERLQIMAQAALATLNLAATTQELTQKYPALVNASNRAGTSAQELAGYLIANGISADEWASKVTSATGSVINDFQKTKTSIGLSIEEMASNLEANIKAQQDWNTNIETLMAAAQESGNEGAIAFVQHMQEMGVGAAEQVAAMVEDVDGTLDTFGPLFEEAADAGLQSTIDGVEAGKMEVTGSYSDMMDEAVEGMADKAGDAESAGQEVAEAAKSGAEGVDFTPVGTQADAGFAKGIRDGRYNVESAMVSVARAALIRAKAELEIHSPSDVFRREVGEMITRGIAVGMIDPVALKTVQDSGDRVTSFIASLFGVDLNGEDTDSINAVKAWKDAWEQAFEDDIRNQEFAYELAKRNGADSQTLQKMLTELQNTVHRHAEEGRAMGLTENDEYIQKLSKQWWGYEDDRISLIDADKKAEDEAREASERAWDEFYAEQERKREEALRDIENYQKQIESLQNNFQSKLSGNNTLFDFTSQTHGFGANVRIRDPNEYTQKLNEYASVIRSLKERGIGGALLQEVLNMSMSDAVSFGRALLRMTDEDFASYNQAWVDNESLSKSIAEEFTGADYSEAGKELAESISSAFADEENPLAEGLASTVISAYSKASELVATTLGAPVTTDDLFGAVSGAVNGITAMQSGAQIYIPLQLTIDGRVVAETTFEDFVRYASANGTPIVTAS